MWGGGKHPKAAFRWDRVKLGLLTGGQGRPVFIKYHIVAFQLKYHAMREKQGDHLIFKSRSISIKIEPNNLFNFIITHLLQFQKDKTTTVANLVRSRKAGFYFTIWVVLISPSFLRHQIFCILRKVLLLWRNSGSYETSPRSF